MSDKPRKPTPSFDRLFGPREPDASGDPEREPGCECMIRRNAFNEREIITLPKCPVHGRVAENGLTKRLRDQAGLLKRMDEVAEHRQTSAPTQKLLIAAADTLDAQATEIARQDEDLEAFQRTHSQWARQRERLRQQNAALRKALREYLDWHETNFVLPSGNFEDPDQMALAKAARAALEASDEG